MKGVVSRRFEHPNDDWGDEWNRYKGRGALKREVRNTRQQLPGRSHAALRDACSATHTFRKRSKVEWTGEEYEEAVVRTRAGIIRVPASIISQSRSAPGGGRKHTRALPALPTSTAASRTFVWTRRPIHKAALRFTMVVPRSVARCTGWQNLLSLTRLPSFASLAGGASPPRRGGRRGPCPPDQALHTDAALPPFFLGAQRTIAPHARHRRALLPKPPALHRVARVRRDRAGAGPAGPPAGRGLPARPLPQGGALLGGARPARDEQRRQGHRPRAGPPAGGPPRAPAPARHP